MTPTNSRWKRDADGGTVTARVQFALALVLDALGAGVVLLVAGRDWQTVVTPRGGSFPDDTLQLTGRTVDAASTALALVALAGVVAVIATRGVARRVVGVVIALAGAGVVWRSLASATAISTSRARDLVRDRHPSAASTTELPQIATHVAWPAGSVAAAVLVLCAGILIAWRGARWTNMSARYESPATQADPDEDRVRRERANVALWSALDRGDDPTDRDPRDTE